MTNRRRVLLGLGAAGALSAGWRYWPEQGFTNPCGGTLPRTLREHEIVRAAWAGLSPERVWDCHVHLVGTGDSNSGIWLNPAMHNPLSPMQYAQRLFFLNAGCADQGEGRIDASYVERMLALVGQLGSGAKLMLMAFDYTYDTDGRRNLERTAFHTPNEYAARIAQAHERSFEWIASVHPYRRDCVEALEAAAKRGARAIKWLPPAMGIDPASPQCDRFYEAARRLHLPLLTHSGQERAVHGANAPELGNPLRLRRALDHGVKVVVAHCATMGEDRDIDQGSNGPTVPSFELFARLMDEPRYVGRLFGEISAVTQLNRAGPFLHHILQRAEWHPRLLNGTDYPLPGIMPLFSVDAMIQKGFLDPGAAGVLKEVRTVNPLLFDLVLKRQLRSAGHGFPASVFQTRDFFDPQSTAVTGTDRVAIGAGSGGRAHRDAST